MEHEIKTDRHLLATETLLTRRKMASEAAREQFPANSRWRERSAFVRAALRRFEGHPEQRMLRETLGRAADQGDCWAMERLLEAQDDSALIDQLMGHVFRLADAKIGEQFGPFEVVDIVEGETHAVARTEDGFGRPVVEMVVQPEGEA